MVQSFWIRKYCRFARKVWLIKMRIIFVRHGEPDYKNDTLTEKGKREANLLSERIRKWEVTDFYCSPLGRAKATALPTLEKTGRSAETLEWTQEFFYPIDDPVTGRHGVPWDLVPSFWSGDPLMLSQEDWVTAGIMRQNSDIPQKRDEVFRNLDKLVEKYGYVRDHNFYRAVGKKPVFITSTTSPDNVEQVRHPSGSEKEPVIVIFCHLGAICMMLSHLINIPFPLLAHGFFLPPTSLTILATEERWDNEAYFRVQSMGDVHHLLAGGEPVAQAGYFASPFQS